MRKVPALFGSAIFFVIAPGTLAGLVPWWIGQWQEHPPFFASADIAGAVLIALGLVPLLESFVRFAVEGLGTPAPVAPPQQLVIGGFYRHVRNPIYVGVVTVILGQALMFSDGRLLIWAAIVWVSFHLLVLVDEEPTLSAKFGVSYDIFRANVPRWLPRLTPWHSRPDQGPV
jgi:protein-S-isoprenylcysteine O-methyltransferase Ste14